MAENDLCFCSKLINCSSFCIKHQEHINSWVKTKNVLWQVKLILNFGHWNLISSSLSQRESLFVIWKLPLRHFRETFITVRMSLSRTPRCSQAHHDILGSPVPNRSAQRQYHRCQSIHQFPAPFYPPLTQSEHSTLLQLTTMVSDWCWFSSQSLHTLLQTALMHTEGA